MRTLSWLVAFSLFSSVGFAQALEPCGSIAERSPWLKEFQQRLLHEHRPTATQHTLALEVHLLANDPGSEFDYGRALQTLGALERDFVGTGIGFRANLNFDTLYSAQFNDHATVLEGADMMFANNVDNALNLYFVGNPAGNCGYNLPYAGIAVSSQCAGASSKTIAHEVGHALSLPHPFLGWEGGQTADGSMPANFSAPAPEAVTYDYTYFQDTLIRDTLIIDTALVEFVDRRNCLDAADGFCDTPADYLAGRWTCDDNGESTTVQLDPEGVSFRSDGSLIMNYANDDCQTRFSADQQLAMQAFIEEERSYWQTTQGDTAKIRDEVLPAYVDGDLLPDPFTLPMTAVANATHYFVQISTRRSFSVLVAETVTTSTNVDLDPGNFEPGTTYYWRAYPFSDHSFRASYSPRASFVYPEQVATTTPRPAEVTVYPNPVLAGNEITLPNKWTNATYSVVNSLGQEIQSGSLTSAAVLQIGDEYPSGNYVVHLMPTADSPRAGVARFVVN